MNDAKISFPLVVLLPLLASIMALSPLAIDLYLPAMPIIAQSLTTDMAMMQNTLSIYLVGYALGLLVFGPLADRVARRPLVFLGISGFAIASFMLPWVNSIEQFILIRFVQAFISSAATVVVPGTIREYYGKNTAKGLSYVSMIMMVAPMAAPSIGSVLLLIDDWQLIFFSLTGYALLILALSYQFLPNSTQVKSTKKVSFLARYKLVLGHRKSRLDLIVSMMSSLAFFSYLTAITFVYMTVFGTSEFTFSLLFAANVIALMIAHFINTRLVVRKGSRKMMSYGMVVAILMSTTLVAVTYWQLPLAYTVIAILPLMGSISMMAVNADALVLQEFTEQSGTATAVIGILRFGIGGLAGPILAFFHNGSAMPFCLLMWIAVVIVILAQLPNLITRKASSQ